MTVLHLDRLTWADIKQEIQNGRVTVGVDAARSGAHSGEWETSLMLALRPEQVKMDRAAEGFIGELSEITSKVFDGIQNLDQNGVLGDQRPATAEAGEKYLEDIVEYLYQWVRDQG